MEKFPANNISPGTFPLSCPILMKFAYPKFGITHLTNQGRTAYQNSLWIFWRWVVTLPYEFRKFCAEDECIAVMLASGALSSFPRFAGSDRDFAERKKKVRNAEFAVAGILFK